MSSLTFVLHMYFTSSKSHLMDRIEVFTGLILAPGHSCLKPITTYKRG